MKYRAELDGLRAIALIGVVLFHSEMLDPNIFSGGFLGVDVFFVLSGYLMTSIIRGKINENKFSLIEFFERRARRLAPTLLFVLITSYAPAWRWLYSKNLLSYSKSALWASLGVSNFYFIDKTMGYFDEATSLVPLVHTWTLGVEEQFYIVLPLIFIIFNRGSDTMTKSAVITLTVISFGLTFRQNVSQSRQFYMLDTRFWELSIGSLVALFDLTSFKSDLLALTSLFTVINSMLLMNKNHSNPSYLNMAPTLGTALFIAVSENTYTAQMLSIPPLRYTGLISYSMYLWHQPVFVFARFAHIEQLSSSTTAVLILGVFVLSFLSWYFIEQPCRDREKISGRFFLVILLTLWFTQLFLTVSVDVNQGFPSRFSSLSQHNTSNMLDKGFQWTHTFKTDYITYCHHTSISKQLRICRVGGRAQIGLDSKK